MGFDKSGDDIHISDKQKANHSESGEQAAKRSVEYWAEVPSSRLSDYQEAQSKQMRASGFLDLTIGQPYAPASDKSSAIALNTAHQFAAPQPAQFDHTPAKAQDNIGKAPDSPGDASQLDNSHTSPAEYQYMGFKFERYPEVSDEFANSAEKRLQEMPAKEREFLQKAGVKVILSDTLKQADPSNTNPFDERGGEFISKQNAIVLAQLEEDKIAESVNVKMGVPGIPLSVVPEHTFAHEWGHALNENMKFKANPADALSHDTVPFSESSEFASAYNREIVSANDETNSKELSYYIGGDVSFKRRRSETCAEIYAALRVPNAIDYQSQDTALLKDFPETVTAVKKQLLAQFGAG